MRKFFQKIRKKPKAVRDNYAFGIAASFTLVVMLIWVVAKPAGSFLESGDVATKDKEVNSPFSTLIKETKEQLASLKEATSKEGSETEATSTATTSAGMVLSQEDLNIAKTKLEQSTTTAPEPVIYQEVMIGTTTDNRKPTSATQNSATASSSTSL